MADKLGARKNGAFVAVCTAPSFNKTPIGPSTPPVPYPVFQDLSGSIATAGTVCFNGDPAYLLNQSTQPMCTGDAPGVALGVKSGTVSGEVKPMGASSTVKACGKPVVREGDPCTLNGGNCPGIYVTQPSPGGAISDGEPTPATDEVRPETAAEVQSAQQQEGFWGRMWREVKEAVQHPWEGAKGAVKGVANIPSNLLELLAKGSVMEQAGKLEENAAIQGLFGQAEYAERSMELAQEVRRQADAIAIPKFQMDNPAQSGGDTIATVAQLLWAGAGLAKGGLKAVSSASKIEGAAAKTEAVLAKAEGAALRSREAVNVVEELPKSPSVTKAGPSAADGVKIKGSRKRPSWRQSEKDVGERLGKEYSEQRSFKDGEEVPYGTEGSTRPDWYKGGSSIEVKNYNVESMAGQNRLVENVTTQAINRAKDLPPNTVQSLMIDVRGQAVSRDILDGLVERITTGSKGIIKPENITILR